MSEQQDDLIRRLSDLSTIAGRLVQLIEAHGQDLPAILLSRLHVAVDDLAARLDRHRVEIEHTRPKK
jgi:hypothetical protein